MSRPHLPNQWKGIDSLSIGPFGSCGHAVVAGMVSSWTNWSAQLVFGLVQADNTSSKGADMSSLGQEFARYAAAEQQMCEQAGPALLASVRGIEMRLGIRITEVRVTLERHDSTEAALGANCTIVGANEMSAPAEHDLSDLKNEVTVASAIALRQP
jgi:hypothetical protein